MKIRLTDTAFALAAETTRRIAGDTHANGRLGVVAPRGQPLQGHEQGGHPLRRRDLVLTALAAGMTPAAWARSKPTPVEVWKSPECDCCKAWVSHLERHGFVVTTVHHEGNSNARKALGIPLKFGSCHTAKVGGYALEGHVPAREIRRLLAEAPQAVGLAVPAMPLGSPGMDGPEFDGQTQPYDVFIVLADGSARVYESYS